MLTKIFTVEVVSPQSINTFATSIGSEVPSFTCLNFSSISSKYVCCVDSSIDVVKICADNGFIYEYIHDLEVTADEYNKEYTIGTNAIGSNVYHLFFIKTPKPIPEDLSPPDLSMNNISQ